MEMFRELEQLIDTVETPILAVVVAEGCENFKGRFLTDLEEALHNQPNKVHLHVMCYTEEPMAFPRPLTPAVYYFAPKNYKPLFFRSGPQAITVAHDIPIALKMMGGMTYTEAAFTPEVKEKYEKTDEMLKTEDTSKFPSLFQQARNLAKEMWSAGKNAAQGLPIIVDTDTAFNRLSLCQGCEFLKENFRCEKCGCFMKAKTQLASASCPIGKWQAVN